MRFEHRVEDAAAPVRVVREVLLLEQPVHPDHPVVIVRDERPQQLRGDLTVIGGCQPVGRVVEQDGHDELAQFVRAEGPARGLPAVVVRIQRVTRGVAALE